MGAGGAVGAALVRINDNGLIPVCAVILQDECMVVPVIDDEGRREPKCQGLRPGVPQGLALTRERMRPIAYLCERKTGRASRLGDKSPAGLVVYIAWPALLPGIHSPVSRSR